MGIGVITVTYETLHALAIAKDEINFTDVCSTCHPEILDKITKIIKLPPEFGVAFVSREQWAYGFSVFIASRLIPDTFPGGQYPKLDVIHRVERTINRLEDYADDSIEYVTYLLKITMPDGTVIYDRDKE